jgi:hypothetical protein
MESQAEWDGERMRLLAPYFAGSATDPALSPGGKRALIETHDPRTGKMIDMIFPLRHPRRTTLLAFHRQMEWAPQGQGVTFVRSRHGADNIWLHPLSGVRSPDRQITHFAHHQIKQYVWQKNGALAVVRNQIQGAVELLRPAPAAR